MTRDERAWRECHQSWALQRIILVMWMLARFSEQFRNLIRILAIITVMNSLGCGADQGRDHPHHDVSGAWPGCAHDVSHAIPSVFTPRYRPGARKTRIILRAVTGIVSHDNHNGMKLWLVSDLTYWPLIGWYCPHVSLDMHITLSFPLSGYSTASLSRVLSESWTLNMLIAFIDTDSGPTGAAETVVMLVLPSHCSSHQGEQAGFDRTSRQSISCKT